MKIYYRIESQSPHKYRWEDPYMRRSIIELKDIIGVILGLAGLFRRSIIELKAKLTSIALGTTSPAIWRSIIELKVYYICVTGFIKFSPRRSIIELKAEGIIVQPIQQPKRRRSIIELKADKHHKLSYFVSRSSKIYYRIES